MALQEIVTQLWRKHVSQTVDMANKEKARLISKIALKQVYQFQMNNLTFNDAFSVMTFD